MKTFSHKVRYAEIMITRNFFITIMENVAKKTLGDGYYKGDGVLKVMESQYNKDVTLYYKPGPKDILFKKFAL